MSKNRKPSKGYLAMPQKPTRPIMVKKSQEIISLVSMLDHMVDGREYESLIRLKGVNVNPVEDIRIALREIASIRNRPNVAYVANVVNPKIRASKSIDNTDDLPFSELINSIPITEKHIDIVLVTPGGSGPQVAKFVDKLRPRFDTVAFIIPNVAMSAGTMFVMSGDDIIMNPGSYIGPIDPQVLNKDGVFVPAQSILTLIDEIQRRGQALVGRGMNPDWTDLQILRQMDPKEIGNAMNASKYSIDMVENYLHEYKFRNWTNHSDGRPVTSTEKRETAHRIADLFCDHSVWRNHGRGIPRESAWEVCRLKITHAESIPNLDRAMRRFWALCNWVSENTPMYKMFMSDSYTLFRNENILNQNNGKATNP